MEFGKTYLIKEGDSKFIFHVQGILTENDGAEYYGIALFRINGKYGTDYGDIHRHEMDDGKISVVAEVKNAEISTLFGPSYIACIIINENEEEYDPTPNLKKLKRALDDKGYWAGQDDAKWFFGVERKEHHVLAEAFTGFPAKVVSVCAYPWDLDPYVQSMREKITGSLKAEIDQLLATVAEEEILATIELLDSVCEKANLRPHDLMPDSLPPKSALKSLKRTTDALLRLWDYLESVNLAKKYRKDPCDKR